MVTSVGWSRDHILDLDTERKVVVVLTLFHRPGGRLGGNGGRGDVVMRQFGQQMLLHKFVGKSVGGTGSSSCEDQGTF